MESYGKYQLVKRLAMGGMAQIFLAYAHGADKQRLVIKRILPHLADNKEFVQMFLDEARIAARLDHPNIVQIFDLGAQDDSFFIAMEYIHGEDLRRVWKRAERQGGLIPVPLVCRVLSEACAGLDHAHKKTDANGKPLNIVHRDISPQNILLTFEGRAKVVDFGIAKAADQGTETRSGVLKGKYSYMSPEQANGQKLDRRSDIFALGVVLYELLTGTRLFKRANDIVTLQAVSECKIIPPSQVNARVPRELDAIVMKALARESIDRYPEAMHLQRALENWLQNHPQPSSPAHVAAYMKELYAARLAEEARLGDVVVEEAEAPAAPRPPPPEPSQSETMAAPRNDTGNSSTKSPPRPSLHTPRATLGRKRTVDLRRAAAEPTLQASDSGAQSATPVMRPSQLRRALPRPEPKPESKATSRALVGIGVGVLVGLLLGGAWALRSESSGSAPTQPLVAEPMPSTPTPSTSAASEPTPSAPEAAVPAPVRVKLTATPEEAELTVDGKVYNQLPVEVSARPGQELMVVARAPRYQPQSRTFTVGQGPVQEERVRLEPLASPPRVEHKTEPRPSTAQVERPAALAGTGTIRFAVTPWAEVTCGGRKLGTTPMRDVSFNVGVYACIFKNSDLGAESTKRVEVKANATTTVTVKF